MREYMREKRWRERNRLGPTSLNISTSRVKIPIQRLKRDDVPAHVEGHAPIASSIEMRDSRESETKEESGEVTKQQRVPVDRMEGNSELVDYSRVRRIVSQNSTRKLERDEALKVPLLVTAEGMREKGRACHAGNRDVERRSTHHQVDE